MQIRKYGSVIGNEGGSVIINEGATWKRGWLWYNEGVGTIVHGYKIIYRV